MILDFSGTNEELLTILREEPELALVDFWAPWCGPCIFLAPVLKRISRTYKDRMQVVKIDIDANPSLAERYKVKSIPTLVFMHNGREVKRLVGVPKEQDLVADIEDQLARTSK